ncbi:hypothetical protein HK105_202320 [Polyrhizophydium stewartii]|uniref:Glutathione hydrolase n=1 Tax=Polyrhizophydium stewartii TaxID=2732419 RepID=A0ABR4NEK3_9FUNG
MPQRTAPADPQSAAPLLASRPAGYQAIPNDDPPAAPASPHAGRHRPLHVLSGRRMGLFVSLSAALLATAAFTGLFLYIWTPEGVLEHGRRHGLASSTRGVVASEHPLCSSIGTSMLSRNGSAMDAAIAAALCIGVTNMYSSGIGGGGFLVARDARGRSRVIDFREEAPAAAHTDMFRSDPKLAQTGGLAVGVPGEIYGFHVAHQMYGRLPWHVLFEPSIELSRNGWPVNDALASRIQSGAQYILNDTVLASVFAPEGRLLTAGETIRRPTYAATLETLARGGVEAFYTGPIAAALVRTARAHGGVINLADFAAYRPVVREPLVGSFRGRRVVTAPPPTSGSALLAALNFVEGFDAAGAGPVIDSHRCVEAWKYAYAQRGFLGDPVDPVYRNITQIVRASIDKELAEAQRRNSSDDRTFDPPHYEPHYDILSDHGTMHLTVLTSSGEAVSMTSTVNLLFGSKLMDAETGIILNDQMDDFSIPGVANAFGLEPSPYNYVHPRKRPLSSSVPVIVEKRRQRQAAAVVGNGDAARAVEDAEEAEDEWDVVAVAGASGGSHIITSTMQTLLGIVDRGLDPAHAVHAPRLHHQLLPNAVVAESEVPVPVVRGLVARGHAVNVLPPGFHVTGVQAASVDPSGLLLASSDWRKGGVAAGV